MLVLPLAAAAQIASPEILEKAAKQTGKSPAELEALMTSQAAIDTLKEPGLSTLPLGREDQPMVILPMSDSEEIGEALEEMVAEGEQALDDIFFGADFFHLDAGVFNPSTFGPVPEDYLVGVGDQIVVDIWGEVELRHERYVDRDGTIILPKAGRIQCFNRTLDDLRGSIREQLARSYSGIDRQGQGGDTFVQVSLGALRSIRVFVVGEVAQPGAYELSSVSTLFTALYAAGGPGQQGSLRNIKLMRGDKEAASLDVYDYLLSGSRADDVILRDGDTVFVPARTLTVSITGEVRRPLYFEMKPDEGLRDLIRFAGGFTPYAASTIIHAERVKLARDRATLLPDRIYEDMDLRNKMKYLLRDGDRFDVHRIDDRQENWVDMRGNVKQPGFYAYVPGMTVKQMVERAGGYWADTIEDRALLERVDPDGFYRGEDFQLGAVMRGEIEGPELQPRDTIRILSIWNLRDRYKVRISGEVREFGEFDYREGMTLRDLVLRARGLTDAADNMHAEVSRLRDSAMFSRDPGVQPESSIELIKVEMGENWLETGGAFKLKPYDSVVIRRLPWFQLQRMVNIDGEVVYPGNYALDKPDERLSDLIARAGGLRRTAYAPGARIVRKVDGIGNVAVDLNRAMDKPYSEVDPILMSGDAIKVPPVPTTVKVVGAVGFPTSVIYNNGSSIGDYIAQAGGFSQRSDRRKAHVVYPNGVSRAVRRFRRDPGVLPGSTIVVPPKIETDEPTKLETLREVAAVFASMATVWLVIDRTN